MYFSTFYIESVLANLLFLSFAVLKLILFFKYGDIIMSK